jgi:hypothetical protein
MPDETHIGRLRHGVEERNARRRKNPGEHSLLKGAVPTGANLSRANVTGPPSATPISRARP